MEKVNNTKNNTVSTGWVKTTKESALSAHNSATNKVVEDKIVSRVTFEPDPYAHVSFNTYQDILDRRNQMLGTVKPSLYTYDTE
ncbi:hypothetical protein AHMF7605_05210 [Adhaeribacter arboris]|uniref:Uncharacterized protein n=1 Tax=Adhaeribacter arboris TaxID=2072846 RepID=A0A2T2YBU8_9BACT|nr:hypothetical protein [Adhaeribacter arboris]PSR52966.1 hypothetical protein AHMF7605_05210 [Adhaeribacter arboris]